MKPDEKLKVSQVLLKLDGVPILVCAGNLQTIGSDGSKGCSTPSHRIFKCRPGWGELYVSPCENHLAAYLKSINFEEWTGDDN